MLERHDNKRQKEGERNLLSDVSFPNMAASTRLSQAEGKSLELHPDLSCGWQGLKHGDTSFPGALISRELD